MDSMFDRISQSDKRIVNAKILIEVRGFQEVGRLVYPTVRFNIGAMVENSIDIGVSNHQIKNLLVIHIWLINVHMVG